MLFEKDELTPTRCAEILSRAFLQAASREGVEAVGTSVPLPVLQAHGDFDGRARFLCEATTQGPHDRLRAALLRKIERTLDGLPEAIVSAMNTPCEADWMMFYRRLLQLHEMLIEAGLCEVAEEYDAIVTRLVKLASSVAEASLVQINAASMFTLLLMQVHIRRRPRKAHKKRRLVARKKSARK